MTKNFKKYVVSVFTVMSWLCIANGGRAMFEKTFQADLVEIRWGIWITTVVALGWFLYRGIDGFYKRGDFWWDERDWR